MQKRTAIQSPLSEMKKRFMVTKQIAAIFILSVSLMGSVSCKKNLPCTDCDDNQPPVANAGSDQRVVLPIDSVTLDGSASGDPDGNIAKWQWTKVSGPTSFAVDSAGAAKTKVRNLAAGIYQFQLEVKDNGDLFATDTVQVIVDDYLTNQPPVANAGADQVIDIQTTATFLDGSQSADPENNITSFLWTKVSGPASYRITNATAAQTQVMDLMQGVYQFELKVTDAGGLFSKDTVKVTVNVDFTANQCGDNRAQLTAQLVPIGTLSKSRANMAVGTAGTKILFAGGNAQNEPDGTSRVDIYDSNTKTWSTAELSKPRYDITAVTAGDKIFFAGGVYGSYGPGGNNNAALSTTVDIYDASTNSWSVTSLPLPRSSMAAAAVGGKVFFAGGMVTMYGTGETDRVEIYDVTTKTWSVKLLTERKFGVSAVTLGNRIYFAGGLYYYGGIGGDDSVHFSDRVEIYDNASNSWTTLTLAEGKYDLAGATVGDKIYWAGGTNYADLCKVEIRNVATQASSQAYLSASGRFTAALRNSQIVYFKLWPSDGTFDVHDVNTNTWAVGRLSVNLVQPSIISVSNSIYVGGGFLNNYSNTFNNLSDQVYILAF
jgi:hypothetical protein